MPMIDSGFRPIVIRFLRLLTALLLLAGCAVNPVTGKKELALVPVSPAEEIALGEKAFPQAVQQMGGELDDPALAAYVSRIGLDLARLSERPELPWEFKVINDSTPNAFALPGGRVAVTRGLLANLENEAQLAAVLGHEIGHVTARHSVQGIQRGTLLNLGLAVLSGVTSDAPTGQLAQQAGQLTATLVDRSYSREQERESDRLGIDYMVKAGYNPQGAVQVQELFYRKIEGGAEPQWLSGLFRSHPFSKERMLDNESYILTRVPHPPPGETLRPAPFQEATARLRARQEAYALFDRARQLEGKGDRKNAVATYLQAATAAPDEYLILTGLGLAYLRAEDPVAARPHLARAVQANGNYFLSRLALGYALLEQKDEARAVEELEASMRLLRTAEGGFLLAQGYEKTGQRQKAAELYRGVAQADPQGKLGRAAAERLRAMRVR